MGIPSWTIDGSDPAIFYASTAVAKEFSSAGGGATLIHVETMRGCGHAHHHDCTWDLQAETHLVTLTEIYSLIGLKKIRFPIMLVF